ncbi:MAG TPA: hypothetical protein VG711_01780, partial [Phycisphaerales bacterium]|nr:hypothetical protein [Phycisphaerales bacterium]
DKATTKKLWVQLRGQVMVTAVDRIGRPTSLKCKVVNCMLKVDDQPTRAIHPNDVIIVESKDGTTKISLADREVTPDVRDAVLLAFQVTGNEDELPADEVLGTKDRKKPGDKWTIHREEAAKNFQLRGDTVPPDAISGETTLVDLRDYAGIPCLHVKSMMRVENYAPGMSKLPPGFKVTNSVTTAEVEGLMPINTQALAPDMTTKLTMDIEIRGTAGIKNSNVLIKKHVSREVSKQIQGVSAKPVNSAPASKPDETNH